MSDQSQKQNLPSTRDVLYRKYRSQNFDELVGQEHITKILKNGVKKSAISHAYLFVGSRGTGKTSSARILAKALNCTDRLEDGNPCNRCDSCLAITSGLHLDIIEIDAASNRGIDQIRELKERIEFAPSLGNYKIYIIDEVHMLTTEAFNALLKTLEEPPKHVIFILATTDVHKLPATILSRCQRYDFRLGTYKQIEEVIINAAEKEGVKLSEDALKILVENAHGSYRDALSLLDVVVSGQLDGDSANEVSGEEVRYSLGIPDSTMVFQLLDTLVVGESTKSLDLIDELSSRGINLQQFVKYILSALREILISQIRSGKLPEKYQLSREIESKEILKLINHFLDAERKLKFASTPELILEMVIAELAQPATTSTISITHKSNKVIEATAVSDTHKLEESKVDTKADKIVEKLKEKIVEVKNEEKEIIELNTNESEIVNPVQEKQIEESQIDQSYVKSKLNITLAEIESKWDKLLTAIQQINGPLFGFLKSAKLNQLDGGFLMIDVPFQFHKDRIEAPKVREFIGDQFKQIYGVMVPFRCEVNSGMKSKKRVAADVILKNMPKSEPVAHKPEENSTAPSSGVKVGTGHQRKFDSSKPRVIDKKIEALFEGM